MTNFILSKLFPKRYDYDLSKSIEKKILFIHIPKTGGVSINRTLLNSLGGGHKSYIEYKREIEENIFNELFIFSFVRNPVDRFLSAYNFLYGGGYDKIDQKWAKQNLIPYSINFFTLNKLENCAESKVHFKPQNYFLKDEFNQITIDFIGKFEKLAEDFNSVKKLLELNVRLKKLNKSKKYFSYKDLSSASIKKIEDIYQQDFIIFGY